MSKKVALLAAVCLPFLATSASATDVTDNLNLQATIVASCTVTVGVDIDFGAALVTLASNVDAATTADVNCSNGTPYSIGIGNGNNGNRFMHFNDGVNDHFIDYELYTDVGRTTRFENIGTSAEGGTGTGAVLTHNIYARIPSQTTPANGTYTDVAVVSVRY